MKRPASLIAAFVLAITCRAATTIDPNNSSAWGGNVGFVNFAGDTTNGAVIGAYICTGYVYGANVGWINLGSGTPANHIQYQNNSATDFGVNFTPNTATPGSAALRGYAWGANIGWINFESTGNPGVDFLNGKLTGYAWSANCGWIDLGSLTGSIYVKTLTINPGVDTDGSGLPDAWQYTYYGQLGVNPDASPLGDGVTNLDDYLAGTNPFVAGNELRITKIATTSGTLTTLTFTSSPTRLYSILKNGSLASSTWVDSGLGIFAPSTGTTTVCSVTGTAAASEFFRVVAEPPLEP